MACQCVVAELLQSPFRSKSVQEKTDIINKGRPTPKLPHLSSVDGCTKRGHVRYFHDASYERIQWLTGCSNLNRLFCWPCLLYADEWSEWSRDGVWNMNYFFKLVKVHHKTRAHISCCLKLRIFANSIAKTEAPPNTMNVTMHNEQVKENRHILSCFIDAVCFLVQQELDFRGQGKNKGNYIELLNYIAEYDPRLQQHLKSSIAFESISQMQNDVIDAINSVLNDVVRKEIERTEFVSLLFDEVSDVGDKTRISVCFRYVDEGGDVLERFVKFIDVTADMTPEELLHVVDEIVIEYGASNKIVGQTSDGGYTMWRGFGEGGLHAEIRKKYLQAFFVHCPRHDLNLVLQQSVSSIKECSVFFRTLSRIGSFIAESPKRRKSFCRQRDQNPPTLDPQEWNVLCFLVSTEKRTHLNYFLERIVDNADEWDSETVLWARGCVSFLNSFETCFLIKVFSNVFLQTAILSDAFERRLDIKSCCTKLEGLKSKIKEQRQSAFADIWKDACDNSMEQPRKRKNNDPTESYREMFGDILDILLVHLSERFKKYDHLEFITLMDPQKFPRMRRQFPDKPFITLLKMYSTHFDTLRLRNELQALYAESANDNEMYTKPLPLMLKHMTEKQINVVLPEVYKLLKLILTIPAVTITGEQEISKLERIQAYTRSRLCQENIPGVELLSIEQRLLQVLKQNPKEKFSDVVIEKFSLQTGRTDFIYK